MSAPMPSATRTRAKRGEGEKLRNEILEAAERLLIEHGSKDAVSIRAVADACNVTPPAIYMHFADKEQLFLEVCNLRFRELDAELEKAGALSDDPLESLRLRGAAYVRFGLDHPEAYRTLMMTLHEGSIEEPTMEAGRDAFMHCVEAVDRCVKAGVFGDADPYET
ncbi:MAG: TetR/AcrR family transcriptional regulator, partial [Actinomycetota bacterium]|nr:TetR/AcrR family transcriptional regulator [Actinomycetota bacterium]